MNWFRDLKVSLKLAAGFGVCLTFALLAGLVGIQQMNIINDNASLINTDAVKGSASIANIRSDINQYRIIQLRFIIAQSSADMDKVEAQLADFGNKIDGDFSAYLATVTVQEDRENLNQLKNNWAQFRTYDAEVHKYSRLDDTKTCDRLINIVTEPTYNNVLASCDKITNWNLAHGDSLAKTAQDKYTSGRVAMIVLLIVSLICGGGAAITVNKYINENLEAISGRLKSLATICIPNLGLAITSLASGDLTKEIQTGTVLLDLKSKDEFGELAVTLNSMIQEEQAAIAQFREAQANLSELLALSRQAAEAIAHSSSEVAAGNHDLAARTTEQAASLEETASSMEEITSIVNQSAENAKNANKLASDAAHIAKNGGATVDAAVHSMLNISEASGKIAEIITVIDEIAFQTNLLALNAAVEAARVGEQGKGFAVVAAEVRSLAGRSSTAAKEIKALVQDTVHKVEEGSGLVIQSGDELKVIVNSIQRVSEIVAEISSAAQEQASGIEQINKAVMQMDDITQQNAALVEETSAASQSTSHQADELHHISQRFKLQSADFAEKAPQQEFKSTGTYGGSKRPALRQPKQNLKIVAQDATMEEF
jgi:methyl-accepting chemotaxis protein